MSYPHSAVIKNQSIAEPCKYLKLRESENKKVLLNLGTQVEKEQSQIANQWLKLALFLNSKIKCNLVPVLFRLPC